MKFTTTARRGVALVAAGTAGVLLFAGCSAGSLGSSERRQAGRRHDDHLSPRGRRHRGGEREGADRRPSQAANPNITIKHGDPPGRFGG